MGEKSARPDVVVAEIAARQHGVVAIGQLLAAGIGPNGVSGRVRAGRLHRLHQGVYAVGHPNLSREGRWMAAVLACGRARAGDEIRSEADPDGRATVLGYWGAALSHRSAAELWGLLPIAAGPVDVSLSGDGGRRRRRGIRLHRSLTLLPAAVTLREGIPVTTPARTISDLRRAVSWPRRPELVSAKELREAIRQADVLGLPAGPLPGSDRTRSELERAFLRLCRRRRLPTPEVNVRIGPHLVDFLWRTEGLVVETDGYRYHRGRVAFEDDRDRDLGLRALGYAVVRLSHRQVIDEPERVAGVLKETLRRAVELPRGDGWREGQGESGERRG